MTGQPLEIPLLRQRLRQLAEKHGEDVVEAAIEECAYSGGKTFKYFEKCLGSAVARLKGGEGNGETRTNQPSQDKGRFDDEEPDTSWIHSSQTRD